jgi:hypothetical protein
MYHYKIMKQKVSERTIVGVHISIFSLNRYYIKVYIYSLVKFCTFVSILKKFTTVTINMHFISQYVITKVCLTCAHSVHAVLSIWCLEMKHNHRS